MLNRMDRISESLKREISVILQDEINDSRIKNVTITHVEVTRDLGLAKVFYIDTSVEENQKNNIEKGLKKAAGFVRRKLSERISLKFIPRISFRVDTATQKRDSINRILDAIKEERGGADIDSNKGENK